MMSNDYVIRSAIESRTIDLAMLASSAGNTSSAEYYRTTSGRKALGISFITDDRVAETVVCAVHDYFTRGTSAQSSVAFIGQGLIRLFETEPDMFGSDFQKFSEAVYGMDLSAKTDPLKNAKRLIHKNCMLVSCDGDMFASDLWDLRGIPMSPDRRDPACTHNTMDFSGITDTSNKQYLKQYIKHLLLDTHESVNSILFKQQELRAMLNNEPVPFVTWGQPEAERLITFLQGKYTKKMNSAACLRIAERFAQFFVEKDIIPENMIVPFHHLTQGCPYEFRETDRDIYVISQIFNVLNEVRNPYPKLWFLLIFTTGMRKSEASALRRDCLETDANGRHYVRFYNQKMKKDVTNRIPAGLHEMLERHIRALPVGCDYLFPSNKKPGWPIQSNSMSAILKREFIRLGVKNADGTPYVFKAHDLRHWMAKRMYEEDIPAQFIQEQLHHASPEMTMSYIEFEDKAKAKKMKHYVKEHSTEMPAPKQHTVFSDRDYAEYARQKMNLRALPNGMCARPKALGNCLTANSCLFCAEFRTSPRDLPGHREHLKNLDAFICSAERYGWDEQAEESRKTKARLTEIIRELEEMEGRNE